MNIPDLTILTLNTPNISDFAKARNKLLQTVKTPWVLFLDNDEELSDQLVAEIKNVVSQKNPPYDAYYLPRQDVFLGKVLKYGETGHSHFVRLAKRGWGTWQGRVHEQWLGVGPLGYLKSPILHHPHPSLSSFISKIDRYSTLAAAERYQASEHVTLAHIFFYPLAKFVKNYFFLAGFRDGVPGFIHALMMSWHSYLTHTKLYLLWQKK